MDAKKNRGTLDRTLPPQKLQVTSKLSACAAESGGVLAKYGRLRFRTSTMRWPRTAPHNLACGGACTSTALWCATSVLLHVCGTNGATKMSTVDVWFMRALGPYLSELERHMNWVCKDGVVAVSSSHPELASHRAVAQSVNDIKQMIDC